MSEVKTGSLAVRLPDGSLRQYDRGVTPRAIAKSIGSRLAKDAVWAEINQRPVGLDQPIEQEGTVDIKIVTRNDPNALATMRHSCAHIMAAGGDAVETRRQAGFWTDDRRGLLL